MVITEDEEYAERLRSAGILVIDGDPTDDDSLRAAGVTRAQAIMVMLNQDTESLLTVLTARNLDPRLYITAAAVEEELKQKMIKAGANVVLAPYEVASQFLNSATLRPAVNDFFNSILFRSRDASPDHAAGTGGRFALDRQTHRRVWSCARSITPASSAYGWRTATLCTRRVEGACSASLRFCWALRPAPWFRVLRKLCRPAGRADTRFTTFQRLGTGARKQETGHDHELAGVHRRDRSDVQTFCDLRQRPHYPERRALS